MSMEREQIGDCTLYRGDALEMMSRLKDVEAVVMDPPYGHGWKGIDAHSPGQKRWTKRFAGHLHGYNTPFHPQPWLAIGTQHILWGANHYADQLPPSGGWLVWDKRDAAFQNDFSDCELAWTDLARTARLFRYLWHGLCRAGAIGDHLHPNQKPIALMRWCIEKTTGVVLDPFAGSFTTGVACMHLGRQFIGIEMDPAYFDLGCQRLMKAYAQPELFHPPRSTVGLRQEQLL